MIATVRVAPAPPRTMFASGTSVGFVEVAVTVSAPAGVSGVADREAERGRRRVFQGRRVGDVRDHRQVVAAVTVRTKVSLAMPPSASVTVIVTVAVPL